MSYIPQVLPVVDGGTLSTTLTNHGVLIGHATSAVTATSAGTAGQIMTSNGAGSDPTFQDPAVAGALDFKESVRLATAAALPANTFAVNVLTATGNGALTIDGSAVVNGDRVLVKDEAAGANNGIYDVTDAGSAGTPYILTRSADADTSAEVSNGMYTYCGEGTANATKSFVLATADPITLNTTALTFITYSVGGGAPANADYVTLSLNGTLTNERVLTGTASQITITDNGAGSTVVLSTPQNIATTSSPTFNGLTLTNPLTVPMGGTGVATLGDAGVLIGNGTGAVQVTSAGTAGQVLTSNGAGVDPTFQAIPTVAPVNAQYVTLVADATLTQERVLTGTANQIIITDGGAGAAVTLSTPQSIATSSTPTFAGLTLTGRLVLHRVASGAGNYTVLTTDCIIGKTGITGGGDTVTLPDPATVGTDQVFIIKDESGTAATNNITVNTAAGNIDGASTFVININNGSASFYTNGTNYFVW